MKPNLDIVRDLLKKVYSVRNDEPLVIDENWPLSPMGDGNLSPEKDVRRKQLLSWLACLSILMLRGDGFRLTHLKRWAAI